jgi:FKBP-type peptidyl-prolyl cis-trans isomerase
MKSEKLIQENWLSKISSKIILLLVIVSAIFGVIYYINQSNNNTNSADAMTQTLDNGLKIEDTKVGNGAEIQSGKIVEMHYTGKLEDGTVFDSSHDRGETFKFKLGSGQVIQGWEQGIPGMKVGGERTITIPSDLAYGAQGVGGIIPPNANLIFDVEAIGVE